MRRSRISAVWLLAWVAASGPLEVRADGGTLRAWKQLGDLDIAVFTDPSPLVVGPADVSVLVLDRMTGEPALEAEVVVEVRSTGGKGSSLRRRATREASTNQLMRSALFDLPDAGPCEVDVAIDGVLVRFEVDVGRPWSPESGLWAWIAWPLLVIAAYAFHRGLVARATRRADPVPARKAGSIGSSRWSR